MYSISKAEVNLLNDLKTIILENNISFENIKRKCDELSPLIDDIYFPYIYSATLCAAEGKLEEANKLYDLAHGDNSFVSVFKSYLKENGSLIPKVKVFEDNSPYTAWTKTNLARNYIENTEKAVTAFFLNTYGNNKETLSILDIGTGNGILLTEIVNKIISKTAVRSVNLLLLDMSKDMLNTAHRYCKDNIKCDINAIEICCKINKISIEQENIIREFGEIDFVNCALSIHHFPWEEKIRVLKLLREFSEYCIISEVNFNHDVPDKYSPELIYAVSVNMNIIFSDILSSDLTEKEKKLSMEQFFLAEAINIVTKNRSERIDYHTKIRNWKKLAGKAGFGVKSITPNVKYDNRIAAFSMILN